MQTDNILLLSRELSKKIFANGDLEYCTDDPGLPTDQLKQHLMSSIPNMDPITAHPNLRILKNWTIFRLYSDDPDTDIPSTFIITGVAVDLEKVASQPGTEMHPEFIINHPSKYVVQTPSSFILLGGPGQQGKISLDTLTLP